MYFAIFNQIFGLIYDGPPWITPFLGGQTTAGTVAFFFVPVSGRSEVGKENRLLRGTAVNRTCGTHKNVCISVVLLLVLGPIYYGPP